MRAFSVRKLVAGLVTVATLTASLAVTSSAEAKFPVKMFPAPVHVHHGFGGGAALIGALAIGAIAASQDDGCYVVTKRVIDEDGEVYLRRITVCE